MRFLSMFAKFSLKIYPFRKKFIVAFLINFDKMIFKILARFEFRHNG